MFYSVLCGDVGLLMRLSPKPDSPVLEPDLDMCFCQMKCGSQFAPFLSSHVLLSGECAF